MEDYRNEKGLLICGQCGTPKEMEIVLFDKKDLFPITCKCEDERLLAEQAAFEQAQRRRRIENLKRDGITDPAYLRHTFDRDDGRDAHITGACKKYVEQWEEMRRHNIGVLFHGSVGTGKSFMACCIANALLEQEVRVCVTSLPRILAKIQNYEYNSVMDVVTSCSLLVLDDLGTERSTTFGLEKVFEVIDARLRTGKPVIVTTNMSVKELEEQQDVERQRIYDRVLEMCPIRISMAGESRRRENARRRQAWATKLLRGAG